MPLLTNDVWRKVLCQSIERAVGRWNYRLVAFVLMPEHLHLLVLPIARVDVDRFLSAVKRPHSVRIKRLLEQNRSPLLQRLTIQERPGKMSFRYWQEGPGYDRNLSAERAVMAAIDDIHENPIRRGLSKTATDWKWSSARWYASDATLVDPDLPTIHGLPWDFFRSE
jgi:putative transposase